MFPFKSIIQIRKNSTVPVYIQIANCFAREIRNGVLKSGTRLPGARSLAELVRVNRNTVSAVYDELNLQGYIDLHPRKGTFVSSRIPDIKAKPIARITRNVSTSGNAGFVVPVNNILLHPEYPPPATMLEFNDGLPDERIAPMEDLVRSYRNLFKRGSRKQFGYSEPEGNKTLRKSISDYLNESRGLQTSSHNIMITRGSQMAIYLLALVLIKPGDRVVTGETSYHAADLAFQHAGGKIHRLPIDARGLDIDQLEKLCLKTKIRAVYVTPHHHFPTTVTLSACRRMKLLDLAEKYGFVIIEDEYDFDFHYKSSPVLPLASADHKGMVVSIGSLSKNFSPALRVGYLSAPVNVIVELAKLRSIIDRQGDYLLEQAIAELFREGVIKRHLRKALTIYHERCDHFCGILGSLRKNISFNPPEGGLAVWVTFINKPLTEISKHALKRGLVINNGEIYNTGKSKLNSTRLGFASLDLKEQEKAIAILREVL